MPPHPHITAEIVRLRELGYGVDLLSHDASTALVRMQGAEEDMVVLLDVAQFNGGSQSVH